MKPGQSRFDYFLNQLQALLTTAARQKNPALWLYRNDARTPLFMLEALAKMYARFHNKKRFTRIQEHFKSLEDLLGAIDYYDAISKDLVSNKKIPAPVIAYLQHQSREKMKRLNEILAEQSWLQPVKNRIAKIKSKLHNADWKSEAQEVKLMDDFYGETIYKTVEFAGSKKYLFTNMEDEVHELRRKLRWMSIYPQAVRGAIQLTKNKAVPKHLTKYLTKEITTSSFNKMPPAADAKHFLLLEQNYFYALSWMIAELGNIKDKGLHIIALKEALLQTSAAAGEDADKKAYQMLGKQQPKMQELLDEAGDICKTYFKEQNLGYLVIGVKTAE